MIEWLYAAAIIVPSVVWIAFLGASFLYRFEPELTGQKQFTMLDKSMFDQ